MIKEKNFKIRAGKALKSPEPVCWKRRNTLYTHPPSYTFLLACMPTSAVILFFQKRKNIIAFMIQVYYVVYSPVKSFLLKITVLRIKY